MQENNAQTQTVSRPGLIGWFINNPVAAMLVTVVLIIGGLLTLSTMKREVFPTISPNTITISVPFPGATPFEVEDGITRRIEEAVLGLDGVKRVQSTAKTGRAGVTVELNDFADRRKVKDDVESAIDQLANFPPENAERPIIQAPEATGGVTSLVISGGRTPMELRQAAEIIERDLITYPGISLVSLAGDRDYEIAIEISETTLREYGLSFDEISRAVRDASVDLSGGQIVSAAGSVSLRVNNKRQSAAAFSNVTIRTNPDGSKITLSDIATIVDGFSDLQVRNTYNGEPAIFLQVSRAVAEDVLKVKGAVDTFLSDYTPPAGITVREYRDQSKLLSERLNLLSRNAVFGFALVFLFLVLMLDLKLAFWVCIGISTAFLSGFLLLDLAGISLTMITMFGLIIVLGLVVDDAVVIGENIDIYRARGYSEKEAAIKGVKGIQAPVLVGVLTTIAAFSPLLFVGGTFGDISKAIPMVIICVLIVSLFEAFFILPSHLSHTKGWSKGYLKAFQDAAQSRISHFANTLLRPIVTKAVQFRYLTLTASFAFVFVCLSMVSGGAVKFVFFPQIEGNEVSAVIELPVDAPFSDTAAIIDQLETALIDVARDVKAQSGEDIIQSISATAGGRSSRGGGPVAVNSFAIASNIGQIRAELMPYGARKLSAIEIERLWREKVGTLQGIERIDYTSSIADFGSDIRYELAHFDPAVLISAVDAFRTELSALEGTYEIDDSDSTAKRELLFELNDTGLAAGLTPRDIARQIRQGFFGEEVQRIQRGREEVKVYVRYTKPERTRLDALNNFRVRLPDGGETPLFTVATITEGRSAASITRVDGRRIISVSANVDEDISTPSTANQTIARDILPELVRDFPGLKWQEAGAVREQNEDFASLANAFLVVLMVVYALVATQFRSYIQPLAILIAIPLGLGGAILGHYVLGFALSFVSMFGIVALSGVAVNASVVLVDHYNKCLKNGMHPIEAAAEASVRRFRPVLLTTLTTALGLLPLLFETSTQAQFLIPMAVSLGFGILVSGFFVILSTPAVCVIIEDMRFKRSTFPAKQTRQKAVS